MKIGSLFSGIGGIELGFEREGFNTAWFVENDKYCQAVLRKNWPEVPIYDDVTTADFQIFERVDGLTMGIPCQPWSRAGKKLGKKDERWIWPYCFQAIRILRPKFTLIENVPEIVNGGGLQVILEDLASIGYDAEWNIISAASVGAPHRRERVFILAHANSRGILNGCGSLQGKAEKIEGETWTQNRKRMRPFFGHGRETGNNPDPNSVNGWAEPKWQVEKEARAKPEWLRENVHDSTGNGCIQVPKRFSDQANTNRSTKDFQETKILANTNVSRLPLRISGTGAKRSLDRYRGSEGMSQWETEPDVGRMAHGIPSRLDRIKCLGNAVVPQVTQFIAKRIKEIEGQ